MTLKSTGLPGNFQCSPRVVRAYPSGRRRTVVWQTRTLSSGIVLRSPTYPGWRISQLCLVRYVGLCTSMCGCGRGCGCQRRCGYWCGRGLACLAQCLVLTCRIICPQGHGFIFVSWAVPFSTAPLAAPTLAYIELAAFWDVDLTFCPTSVHVDPIPRPDLPLSTLKAIQNGQQQS